MGKISWRAGNMLYPLPVVMVSCRGKAGNYNIVTVAWAGTICSDPAMVSISLRKSRFSHEIITESSEFVINLVNKKITKACDYCGVKSGRDVDKFMEMKLTPFVSEFMDTPAISESPVNIYCKVEKIIELGSHDMFLAKVIGVSVESKYMDKNNRFKLEDTDLVAYSHGDYMLLGEKIGDFGYSVKRKKGNNKSKHIKKSKSGNKIKPGEKSKSGHKTKHG